MKRAYSKGRARPFGKVCAWDTETDGFNGKLLCATYATAQGAAILTGTPRQIAEQSLDIMWQHSDATWYSHNGQYDWRYILDMILERYETIEILTRGQSDIFEIKIWQLPATGDKKIDRDIPKLVLRDSFALFSEKLSSFIATYSPENAKLSFDHSKGFDPDNPAHRRYAIQDAIGLRAAVIGMAKSWHQSFGVYPSATISGTALRSWEATIPEGVSYKMLADDSFFREAYYGGLVFLTDTKPHRDCLSIDINSSYPAQMLKHGVPWGAPIRARRFVADKPGFYRVVVTAPENLRIPVLPARHARGGIWWPRGTFETVVTTPEMQEAVKRGYRIDRIIEGWIFPETIFPFEDFIARCKQIRLEKPGTAEEKNAKLAQNSLYGRFGMKTARQKVIVTDDPPLGAIPTAHDRVWIVSDDDAEVLALPHWAAWITAHARLHLIRSAYAVGPEHVLYGDTDSLTLTRGADLSSIAIGTDYGEWKIDKEWIEFRANAPKDYVGIMRTKIGTKYAGKAKGLPRSILSPSPDETEKYDNAQSLLKRRFQGEDISVIFDSVPSLNAVITGRATVGSGPIERNRKSTDLDNARSWERNSDASVSPRRAKAKGEAA